MSENILLRTPEFSSIFINEQLPEQGIGRLWMMAIATYLNSYMYHERGLAPASNLPMSQNAFPTRRWLDVRKASSLTWAVSDATQPVSFFRGLNCPGDVLATGIRPLFL